MIRKTILSIFVVLVLLGGILYFSKSDNNYKIILYSWDLDDIKNDLKTFNKILDDYHINTLYQEFSKEYLQNGKIDFISSISKRDVSIYHLAGDPSWGRKDGFQKMKEVFELVVDFNSKNNNIIQGVVLDIEPYVSEKEEIFSVYDFEIYVSEIKKAYQYCQINGLELVVAIPYWFDKIDNKLLKKLIKNTDEISVMNYKINLTKENLEEEIKFAKKYNKKINTIYEVEYGKNNYFSSKEDIINDYNKVKDFYNFEELGIAFHHYKSIK